MITYKMVLLAQMASTLFVFATLASQRNSRSKKVTNLSQPSGTTKKKRGKISDKIGEAVVSKVTEELLDFLKRFLGNKFGLTVASIISQIVIFLTNNTDRLLEIGLFICLLALLWVGVLIYFAIKSKRK